LTTRLTSVRNIPADVKAELVRDAEAQGRSLADVAAELLAAALGVEYVASGRASTVAPGVTNQLQLRLDTRLASALWAFARQSETTQSRAAISVWAAHYGIRYEPGAV
jgi:plasmid stability protein